MRKSVKEVVIKSSVTDLEEWEKEPEAVMVVPYTPGGALKKKDDKLYKALGTRRIHFVERGGKLWQQSCIKPVKVAPGVTRCVAENPESFGDFTGFFEENES